MKMPLLKELQLKYKELKKQIPKGQVTGENISLNDSSDLPYEDFKINGKSEQKIRDDKNKFKSLNPSLRSANITFKDNDLTIDFSNSIDTYFGIIFDRKINTTYTMVFDCSGVGSSDSIKYNISGNQYNEYILKNGKNVIKFTTDSNEGETRTWDDITRQSTSKVTISNIMILEGEYTEDNVPDYQPYGVMPSPEFPSEIRSVADDVNFFDGELEKGSINGNDGTLANNKAIRSKNFIPVEELTDYKFSSINPEITRLFVNEYKEDYTYNMTTNKDLTNIGTSYFTTNKDTKYIKFRTTSSITDITSKIKLQKGTKATRWSPYGYGSFEITHAHHNLLKPTWAQDLLNRLGVSSTNEGNCITELDGYRYLKYNRILGSGTNLNYFIKDFFKENTQYTFKCVLMKSNDSPSVNFGFVYDDDSYLTTGLETNANMKRVEYKITSEPNKTVKEVRVFNNSGDTYIDLDKCMIYEGTEDLDWEGYGEDIVIQTAPLRSLPNGVCDVKEKNRTIRNIKERVLDGTENWGYDTSLKVFYLTSLSSEIKHSKGNNDVLIMSNYFKGDTANNCTKDDYDNCIGINTLGSILLKCNKFNGEINEFKAFLSEKKENCTPFIICYELAEPIIEEEPCEELKNLHSYKNITNITTEGDIKPELDVTYYKDLETMFKNLEK